MKPLDFSKDNLPNQWRYVNTNLKRVGIWQDIEVQIRDTLRFSIQAVFEEEFAMQIGAAIPKKRKTSKTVRYPWLCLEKDGFLKKQRCQCPHASRSGEDSPPKGCRGSMIGKRRGLKSSGIRCATSENL